jgi:hypothetical protein
VIGDARRIDPARVHPESTINARNPAGLPAADDLFYARQDACVGIPEAGK